MSTFTLSVNTENGIAMGYELNGPGFTIIHGRSFADLDACYEHARNELVAHGIEVGLEEVAGVAKIAENGQSEAGLEQETEEQDT